MPKQKSVVAVIDEVVAAARSAREFGVPGLVRFKFAKESSGAIVLTRRSGKPTNVGKAQIAAAVEGVRSNHRLYVDGPGALRSVGITHVNSPIYALLRLQPLNALI